MMRIKICGLSRYEDAYLASSLGADYLGMVFCQKSKRICRIEVAQKIIANFPNKQKVLVFGYDDNDDILNICERLSQKNYLLQVPCEHPNLPQLENEFGSSKIMVSIPVQTKIEDEQLSHFERFHGIILDTGGQKDESGNLMSGGTGMSFDWQYIKHLKNEYFLAGGLSDQNIKNVLNSLHPYGVDVSSGLEKAPGVKSEEKLVSFIEQIRKTP